jgi:transposase
MPYKTDNVSLKNEFLDRRVKLIACKREMVLYWYERGLSSREIAKMFKVNKTSVLILVNQHIKDRMSEYNKGRWKIYYTTEKRAESQKEHRRYKYKTLKDTI